MQDILPTSNPSEALTDPIIKIFFQPEDNLNCSVILAAMLILSLYRVTHDNQQAIGLFL